MILAELEMFIAVNLFLKDIKFFPQRYYDASLIISIVLEVIFNLFSLELFIQTIWLRLQFVIEFMMKYFLMARELALFEQMGGDNLLACMIFSMSTYFLMLSIILTNNTMNVTSIIKFCTLKFQNLVESSKVKMEDTYDDDDDDDDFVM
jgi:hypothetical protein